MHPVREGRPLLGTAAHAGQLSRSMRSRVRHGGQNTGPAWRGQSWRSAPACCGQSGRPRRSVQSLFDAQLPVLLFHVLIIPSFKYVISFQGYIVNCYTMNKC